MKKLFTFHFFYLKIKTLLRILISFSPLDKSGFKKVIVKCDYESYWFKQSCSFHEMLTISTLNGKNCEQNYCVLGLISFFEHSFELILKHRKIYITIVKYENHSDFFSITLYQILACLLSHYYSKSQAKF